MLDKIVMDPDYDYLSIELRGRSGGELGGVPVNKTEGAGIKVPAGSLRGE
jgi:hypothetical protein